MFIDGEAVIGCFFKSWSVNDGSDRMMDVIFSVEEEFDLPVWIERAPSQTNPIVILSWGELVEVA